MAAVKKRSPPIPPGWKPERGPTPEVVDRAVSDFLTATVHLVRGGVVLLLDYLHRRAETIKAEARKQSRKKE